MTNFRSFLIVSGVVLLMGPLGCSEAPVEQVAQVAPPVKRAVPAPAAENKVPEAGPADVAEATPAFVYDPAGRRDPFESLVALKKQTGPSLDVPKTPLQSYELGQLRLIGVIVGKGQPRAMVVAPDGKSYILTKGIKVGKNDGVVKDISSDAVKVEEQFFEFTGEVRKSIQLIQLPKREGV